MHMLDYITTKLIKVFVICNLYLRNKLLSLIIKWNTDNNISRVSHGKIR